MPPSRPSYLRLWLLFALLGDSSSFAGTPTAFTLFNAVRQQPEHSGIVFAPAAMEDTLSLLYFGSAGETETAFQAKLFPKLSRADAKIQAAQRARDIPGYTRVGGLWTDTRLALADDFKQAAIQDWKLSVARAPLRTDSADSASIINAWLSSETKGRVKSVVTPADIPANTALVGVTVASFISPWKQDYFNRHLTTPETFHFAPKSKAHVSMMKGVSPCGYLENDRFQIVRLDYERENMALLVLLPKQALRFNEALGTFTAESFSKAVAELKPAQVMLWIPKIRYQNRIDWRTPLAGLGLANLLTPQADLSRISSDPAMPISLSKLLQDVRIEWDERGTDATAVTLVSLGFGASPKPPDPAVQFIANHPFAYVIFNTKTLDIYFMGIVSDSSQLQTVQ